MVERTQTSDDVSAKPAARGEPLAPGTMLGRYVVRERLGEGAMGEVYLAYDFALDRRVALKLLHPRQAAHTDATERLLREAKAMARLSHPNVVTVHDVGLVAERAFLAMEYVEGPTLRAWLDEQPRAWRQLRDVFIDAGRGLAAAHAAGLVHRDFKPENVLVDAQGRARVTDFGVARPASAPGGVAGTPGYIAPELKLGEISAAADQYSFCVALSGAMGSLAGVPVRAKAAVQRGLSESPTQRFASMDALLAELSRGPVTPRTSGIIAVGGLLAVVGLGLFAMRRDQQQCANGPAELKAVWDADTRLALERAFAQSPKPYVKAMFPETAARLDRWAHAWTTVHREACEATRVHATQSSQLLDLRMACLGARKAEAQALTELLTTGQAPNRLDRAADAVTGLPSISSCSADDLVHARAEPPATVAQQKKVDAVRTAVAHARARHDTGDVKTAEKELRALVGEAKAIPYAPVQAEAQIQLARALLNLKAFKEAEETAFEAFVAAQGASHDSAAVEAALVGGYASAIALQSADRWRALAAAAVDRDGRKVRHLSALQKMRAYSLVREGQPGLALAAAEEAFALREKELGKDAPELVAEMFEVSQTLEVLGRVEEALALAERQVAIRQKTQGDEHPATAAAQQLRATCLMKLGRLEEALQLQQGVVAVLERAYGKGHPATAKPMGSLAEKLSELGRHAEAIAMAQQALAIVEKAQGSDPTQLAVLRVHVGAALTLAGRPAEALPLLEQGRAVFDKSNPGGFVPLSSSLELLADASIALGRFAEARADAEKCLALREKAHSDAVGVARAHVLLAQSLDGLGDRAQAEQHLDAARAGLERSGLAGKRGREALGRYLETRTGVVRAAR